MKDTELMKRNGQIMKPTKNAAQVADAVEAFREQGANVMVASSLLEEIPPDHRLVIRKLDFDPNRDFYPTKGTGGKGSLFAPSKRALESMASALGVQWRADMSRRIPPMEPNVAAFTAVAVAPDPATGEPRLYNATYELDLRDGSALHEQYVEDLEKKMAQAARNKKDEWKVANHKEAWRRRRRFVVALADTGARLRVIRQIAKVRGDYTFEEIQKPFIAVGMIYTPGSDSPLAALEMAREAQRARMQMYYGGMDSKPRENLRRIDPRTGEDWSPPVDEDEVDLARELQGSPDPLQLSEDEQDEALEATFEDEEVVDIPRDAKLWCDDAGNLDRLPEPGVFDGADRDSRVFVATVAAEQTEYDWQGKLEAAGYPGASIDKLPDNWLSKLYESIFERAQLGDQFPETFDDDDIPFD